MTAMKSIPWAAAAWDHPPVAQRVTDDGGLRVEAVAGSDAWLSTFDGFTHPSAHALLVPARDDR